MTGRGLIFAAPASGSGKTVLVAALARLLSRRGTTVALAKLGPDYIDPAFHEMASGAPCLNIDLWAMRPAMVAALLNRLQNDVEIVVVEGVMGLFDGAVDGSASTADFAALTGWPVILVVDARGQAASAGALVRGFATHRPDVAVAGVIFNRVGGPSHRGMLAQAIAPLGIPLLGCVPRAAKFMLPERHLGLVQAVEHVGLDRSLDEMASGLAEAIDIEALLALAKPASVGSIAAQGMAESPPGQRIAVARDVAFSFAYPARLDAWRAAGAEVCFFSPLADHAPSGDADFIYLPGGYPELHAGKLAANRQFMDGLRRASARGVAIFGECGGYMALGAGLVDSAGERHATPLNVVPDNAVVRFNVRVPSKAAAEWVRNEIERIVVAEPLTGQHGLEVSLHGGFTRPPKPMDASQQALFAAVKQVGDLLGQPIQWKPSGGVCEGNNLHAAGLPNIDTLGVRGGDIHSDNEYAWPESFVERAQLSALILMKLASGEIDAHGIKKLRTGA